MSLVTAFPHNSSTFSRLNSVIVDFSVKFHKKTPMYRKISWTRFCSHSLLHVCLRHADVPEERLLDPECCLARYRLSESFLTFTLSRQEWHGLLHMRIRLDRPSQSPRSELCPVILVLTSMALKRQPESTIREPLLSVFAVYTSSTLPSYFVMANLLSFAKLFEAFPKTTGIRWFNVAVLIITPLVSLYGCFAVPLRRETALFSAFYYVFTMLGITAGYHRLWSHRSYSATLPLQLFLLAGGTSAVQGSCYWWARAHRSHHRHTDTDLDPYNSNRGLLWTHIGWMVSKSELRSGPSDVSDLRQDPLIQWQHRHYFALLVIFGTIVPSIIPGLLFNDWLGGFYFAAAFRLSVAHHSTFCINSIAHWLGDSPYDDALSPRDHFLSSLLTMGEGYHNFHHQFPMDYRNAFLWYQYDPTKWFIASCKILRLAHNLRVFPSNEIVKGRLAMTLKELKQVQDALTWPAGPNELPVVSWETFQSESKRRTLILIAGFIHDVSSLLDHHPGGRYHIISNSGKEMTAAFFGGVYAHSNAAHNLLSMMRVGVLDGGVEVVGQPLAKSPVLRKLCIAEAAN